MPSRSMKTRCTPNSEESRS